MTPIFLDLVLQIRTPAKRWYFVLDHASSKGKGKGKSVTVEDGQADMTRGPGAMISAQIDAGVPPVGTIATLGCSEWETLPVKIDVQKYKSVQWDIHTPVPKDQHQGRFEIILGFSIEGLSPEIVQQLLFRIGSDNPLIEVVTNKTLKGLEAFEGKFIRLKMHTTVDFGSGDTASPIVSAGVELVLSQYLPTMGVGLVLHYFDIIKKQRDAKREAGDSDVKVHKPYIWSLDVDYDCGTNLRTFALSGDGQYIATLSDQVESEKRCSFLELCGPHIALLFQDQLLVWDLETARMLSLTQGPNSAPDN
ncbi:hypothetical protein BG005_001661 [Podila minutissima]|nr:hypothetical protein BG005_001661 [Podila minutissima]